MNYPLDVLSEVRLTPRQLDQLQAIEQYDLWFVVERLTNNGNVAPHRIAQAVLEFKRYIALVTLGYDDLGMHSQEIDEVWHAFILFTREYIEFCQRVNGHIIHHNPKTSRNGESQSPSASTFREAYTANFGPLPEMWRAHVGATHECDAAGEEPDVEIDIDVELPAVDCDVAQDPPGDRVRLTDCNADGADNCRASSSPPRSDSQSLS
jgi:hypothetical protein